MSAIISIHITKIEIKNAQADASQRLAHINQELSQSLKQLDAQIEHVCTQETLTIMRQLLLMQHYVRAFGMLNAQNQLICLTSDGLLAAPHTLPRPDLLLSEQKSWFEYPVQTASSTSKQAMNLVVIGRFAALIDHQLSSNILHDSRVDAIWVFDRSDAGGQFAQVWTRPNLSAIELVKPYQPEQRYKNQLKQWSTLDWSRQRMVVGSNVPMTGYFVQNYVSLWGMLLNNRIITMSVLALAALIGILVGFFVKLKLDQFNLLSFRIRDLCQPEHIVCMYQAIIDLRTGQICGCEVLMRLQDNGKIIFPDQAIPLIQAQNLTWALDSAVSQKAMSELQQYLPPNTVQPFKVALNYFPENITHQRLSTLLQPLQDPRFGLNIEVTEYGVSEDLFADVQKLRQEGYLISVDDFGTGYSNLGTVKRLSPDYLKIDRSFVFDMEDDSLRSSLIPEIVAIAGAVGAEVIAEGIENESQAQRLQAMGVQFGQGYWYGKPQPIAVFIAGLNKTN
ncbi:EAL domain-containing protein [Chitinibacter bivalviorum]|uniref:cyclic-guanylate-specific phosphodiesterase n=1 Tax=Chitinibacter bivalviorum TaxID=2739434 RepID=A0A7H9BL21_9NEIS|nr:EAL domain-containing protein [Chitinibacter bivalviorum]